MKKYLIIISGFIVILITIFSITFKDDLYADKKEDLTIGLIAAAGNDDIYYPVIKIIDGDTFDVEIDGTATRIRPIGIDTPELNDTDEAVRSLAKAAKDKAVEILTGKNVRLESDSSQANLDDYGRSLRYVFLEDGLFFNQYMIENGYAYEYTFDEPYEYIAEFNAAQVKAQESKIGLWSEEAGVK